MDNFMDFTYASYEKLIDLLKENEYSFASYDDYSNYNNVVILRHDVDISPQKSLAVAKLEKNKGVKSTYFVLLTSGFYNALSESAAECWQEILRLGHDIGLHFDSARYPQYSKEQLRMAAMREIDVLQSLLDREVHAISMHRPSQNEIEEPLVIEGVKNSYSAEFFKRFKYYSDSRVRWRENVVEGIVSKQYRKLQILTHAASYSDEKKERAQVFIDGMEEKAYEVAQYFKHEVSDFDEFLQGRDIHITVR